MKTKCIIKSCDDQATTYINRRKYCQKHWDILRMKRKIPNIYKWFMEIRKNDRNK